MGNYNMNTNTDTSVSENQVKAWGSMLASGLSDFPAITHIVNTEGLSSDPSALMAFIRDSVTSQALYTLLSSLNSAHTAAYDKIAISQNQLRLTNEQLCDATE